MIDPVSEREVHLVGSVPLRPAAQVFQTVAEHLGGLVRRIPDGEQRGCVFPIWEHLSRNDALEVVEHVPINPHAAVDVAVYRIRAGRTLRLGPYGIADNALDSYAQFRQLRATGTIPSDVPFQVTVPGPGTSSRDRAHQHQRHITLVCSGRRTKLSARCWSCTARQRP